MHLHLRELALDELEVPKLVVELQAIIRVLDRALSPHN